jgi:hypothetical protein
VLSSMNHIVFYIADCIRALCVSSRCEFLPCDYFLFLLFSCIASVNVSVMIFFQTKHSTPTPVYKSIVVLLSALPMLRIRYGSMKSQQLKSHNPPLHLLHHLLSNAIAVMHLQRWSPMQCSHPAVSFYTSSRNAEP